MSNIKHIRTKLGMTQAAFGAGIGCTQGNVHHYEAGQRVPQGMAARIICFAAQHGLALTYNDIYEPVAAQQPATAQVD